MPFTYRALTAYQQDSSLAATARDDLCKSPRSGQYGGRGGRGLAVGAGGPGHGLAALVTAWRPWSRPGGPGHGPVAWATARRTGHFGPAALATARRTGHFDPADRNDGPLMLFGRGGLPQRWAIDAAPATSLGHRCGCPAWLSSIGGPSMRLRLRLRAGGGRRRAWRAKKPGAWTGNRERKGPGT